MTAETNDSEIPKLLSLLEDVDIRYANIQEWAVRFNVAEIAGKAAGKKRTRTAVSATDA